MSKITSQTQNSSARHFLHSFFLSFLTYFKPNPIMDDTSQTQNRSGISGSPIVRQVIVRLGEENEKTIEELLAEWRKNHGDKSLSVKDSSKQPANLYLLECEETTAKKLISLHPMTVEATSSIGIAINGRHDDNSPDVEIDGDGKFKAFLGNSKMPPITNSNTASKNGFGDIFDSEVTIYMLDTGVTEYGWNTDNLMIRKKSSKSSPDKDSGGNYGYNYVLNNYIAQDGDTKKFTDEHGHGTFGMKVITVGVPAGKIKVVPLKIFNKNGNGTFFDMICAMYQAISEGADIINLSAGFRKCIECIPSILTDVIEAAKNKGIFVVTSAGNGIKKEVKGQEVPKGINLDETLEKYYPAAIKSNNMISVAALNFDGGTRSIFSNFGQSISVATYGENIPNGNGVEMPSGTSVATFYTTKALAAIISKYKAKHGNKDTYIDDIRNEFDNLLDSPDTAIVTTKKHLKYNDFFKKLNPQYTEEPEAV